LEAQAPYQTQGNAIAITATNNKTTWPVNIKPMHGFNCGGYTITGRDTSLDTFLSRVPGGILVSLPNWQRAGIVPSCCNRFDVMNYIGLENEVDAATLAAAVRELHAHWKIPDHPRY
jgi:hypothetical protein